MKDFEWTNFLTNPTSVRAILPEGLPLNKLLFRRLGYEGGDQLSVSLLFDGVPNKAPAKWRARGDTAIQLNFDMGATSLHLEAAAELDKTEHFAVNLSVGNFNLISENGKESFALNARFFYIRLVIVPIEGPRHWTDVLRL